MIYIIDENINRQNELGWNESRFREYSDILFLINDVNSLLKNSTDIKNNKSFVLIHESFKDLTAFSNKVFIENFIKEITEIAKDKKIYLVFFSGGKNERSIVDNIISLPVNIFYQNLSVFLDRYNQKSADIKYLIYGENIQIEENLINLLNTKNNDIDETIEFENSSKSLIVKSFDYEIEDPFKETTSEIIYEDIVTDVFLNEFCINHLNLVEYDNIFIPISFGSVLSDFNGLRLATHIRCTNTINQLKPIFIYSYTELDSIFDTEYFNILKTKNVFIIKHKKLAFREALELNIAPLLNDTLSKEIRKLKLDIPLNHEDQHSIANLWAIYRWSQTIDAKDENIEKIIELQNSNLYFKYLKTINPIKQIDKFNDEQLKIKHEGSPKILYIDDEAEKGWYEIFCEILYEKNKIDFTYLDEEFNEKSQDEIIDLSIKKVIDENIDLVILDFRLHKDDFENKSINQVTGYQILKKIKEYNKGIQVIVFSATNKIWNLQALQDAGADGFIIKEAPGNSVENDFTVQSIENLKKLLEQCINKIFLKEIYTILSPLKEKVELNKNKHPNRYSLRVQQGKLKNYFDYLISADLLLYSNPNNLKYTFLQLILIIEDIIKCFYINSNDGNHYVEISLTEKKICIEKNSSQIILKLNPIEKWNRFSFQDYLIQIPEEISLFNTQADRIPFNYRLNCVLYFKYNIVLEKSSIYSSLYRLRSNSVAHIGNSEVKKEDILNSIELLNILIN